MIAALEITLNFPALTKRHTLKFLAITKSISFTTLTVADPGFSPGGAPTPKIAIIFRIFAKNCMKMKEFGPPGGGGRVPGAPLRSVND